MQLEQYMLACKELLGLVHHLQSRRLVAGLLRSRAELQLDFHGTM